MSGWWQDVRYAGRMLAKNPGSAAIMIFTLALGIGAATAIFSVVYGVLLRPLPYPRPDRLMAVWEVNTKGHNSRLADPNFDDFRDQTHSFAAIAKYSAYEVSVTRAGQASRTTIATVTPQFMQVFGVSPMFGRDFTASDDKQGAAPTAIVSYAYWKDALRSTQDLAHTYVKTSNIEFAVIGVMPAGFHSAAMSSLAGNSVAGDIAIWLPADIEGEQSSRTSHNYWGVARLREGVSVEQARQEISALAHHIREASSEKDDYLLADATVIPLQNSLTGKVRPALLILLGAVGFLLLVACANVANLMLAQASVRERELAVRSALGAARGRLVRQFLTEALLLAIVGGLCGVLGAVWGVAALIALAPKNLPQSSSVSVSLPVLGFALALSLAVAAGLGAFTALRATRGDLRKSLVEGGRAEAGGRRSQRVGRMIVAAQMAITMVLVVGAGLLGRSLMKVLEVNPGFRVDKIIGMDVSLPWSMDPKAKAQQQGFYTSLIERLRQIPGVLGVGAISNLPMEGGLPDGMFVVMSPNEMPKDLNGLENFWRDKSRAHQGDFGVATRGYFETMGIPLVRGRLFDAHDGPNTPHVAVISESLAEQVWPNQDPIGRTIQFGNMDGDWRLLTVVGVVKDVRDYGLDADTQPTVYVDLYQRVRPEMVITMLSDADTRSVTAAARGIVQELNPDVAPKFQMLSQVYSESLGSREFNVILLGFFGLTALLLATAGVFGVMAYTVSRRTKEIGVRVALGASSGKVLTMVLGQGLRTTLIGVAIGIAGALTLSRTLESMLFEIKPNDPTTLAGVIGLLVAAALLACYLPAHRAAKVDPMVALRHE